MIKKETKLTLFILLIAALLVFLVAILLYTFFKKDNEDDVYFPNYEKINIKEDDINNKGSEAYLTLKNQLENDYYFRKEAVINNYNYKKYSSSDIQNMIWNFTFSYEKDNSHYISSFDKDKGTFCMRTKYVLEAFEELYKVNIKDELQYFEGYFQYISKYSDGYCFDYATIAYEYNNNEIYLGVNNLSYEYGAIIADIYLYEFYSMDTDTEQANTMALKNSISVGNLDNANNIVSNYLNGKVSHKIIEFVIKNDGNFFKYQILSSKLLDY